MECVLIDRIPYAGNFICKAFNLANLIPALAEILFVMGIVVIIVMIFKRIFLW